MEDKEEASLNKKSINSHPMDRTNVLSKIFFTWVFPIFAKGYKKDLTEDDLYKPRKVHESKKLGDTLEKAWLNEERRHTKPSLWKVIFKVFGKEISCLGILPIVIELLSKMSQPMLLKLLLDYYVPHQTSVTKEQAYMYAAGLVAIDLFNVILNNSYMYAVTHLGMKVRLSMCSLIYRKSLKLSQNALRETGVGQIINLVSNDVRRFEALFNLLHTIWLAPIEVALVMYLIYTNIGLTALTGMAVLILFVPIQTFLGRKSAQFSQRTAKKRDKRVGLMNEIITGIEVIKMYTWEKPFAKLIEQARKLEINAIKGSTYVRAINMSIMLFMNRFSLFLCILVFTTTGNTLQAQYVYVTTSFYNVLRHALTVMIPFGITMIIETHVSVKRIQQFLANDESGFRNEMHTTSTANSISKDIYNEVSKPLGMRMNYVCAKWEPTNPENTLKDINFEVGPKQLVAVVGTVASGKSTLFQVILKELPILSGTLNVTGKTSYASQEPWLFSASIKQNILFGQSFDADKYQKIIQVCALERDLLLFPYGDRTIVGEKGVTLSGGQKARINLARAIYRDADIYLLDDPLSAVDTHVGKQLFDDCISGYLRNKCTVLITHQLQYLNSVDRIYLLEDGKVVVSGNYREIQSHANEYSKLFKAEPQEKQEAQEKEQIIKKAKSSKKLNEMPKEEKEHRASGSIASQIYKGYLRAGGSLLVTLIVLFLFILAQGIGTCTDYFLTFWVNLEQDRFEASLLSLARNSSDNLAISFMDGSITNSSETSSQEIIDNSFFTSENCMIIYTVLIVLIMITALTRSFSFFKYCLKASQVLHDNMFVRISKTTMRFFHTNPSGRILNRFSNDMGLIDDTLPHTILDTIQIGLQVFSVTVLVCTVNVWFLIPTVCIFGLFYCYRTVYLATSRSLKRMEGTTRSPIFSHFTASLQGLPTIRAYDAQELLRIELDHHQDLYSSAFYTSRGITRGFSFWLDMNCIFYVAAVTMSLLLAGTETYGGNIGLAITQSITLTGVLQWGMRQWSEVENQMTGVERVAEYTEIASEPNNGKKIPPKYWPSEGVIKFDGVSMQYSQNDPYVLKNLHFTVKSNEKVGIVGRTGAGKTSLITALFRLAETENAILIDNVDTKDIPLETLRRNISIIPQEPVLFSGTIRKNLDPFDEFDDDKLWDSLNEVELKEHISELPNGLQSAVSDGGSNFSVGQKQLFCLARALIRRNKILVLDEATANVDPQTDDVIQKTIRRKFEDCTVLTIAHRLHTIMDSDRVLVMDEGRVVEYNHPHVLLQDKGVFYELVMQTGKEMTDNLEEIAKKSYDGRAQIKIK